MPNLQASQCGDLEWRTDGAVVEGWTQGGPKAPPILVGKVAAQGDKEEPINVDSWSAAQSRWSLLEDGRGVSLVCLFYLVNIGRKSGQKCC